MPVPHFHIMLTPEQRIMMMMANRPKRASLDHPEGGESGAGVEIEMGSVSILRLSD
jgi:hypothetical protein